MRLQNIWFAKCRNFSIFALGLIMLLWFGMEQAQAADPRLGLKGYDPVAYFTMGRPAKGNPNFQRNFNDVQYHFISAKHLELFSNDPDKYAPRYNGLCAMGLGVNGYKVEANPENWVIHNDRLYVTQRSFGPPSFRKAPERWIVAAQAYDRVLETAQIGTGISWW